MPKLAIPLTDTKIRNAKPKEKTYTLADGGGMYLEIAPTGSKIWRMSYKQTSGKTNRLSFGAYPLVSLLEAREKRSAARKQIIDGIDPSESKKAEKVAKIQALSNSFEEVAWEWFNIKIKTLSETHQNRTRSYLENDLIPYLGKKNIANIKAKELLDCLRKIESRKNNRGQRVTETANRVRSLMSGLWRFAIQTSRAERDIARDLLDALEKHVSKNFAHIVDPKILGKLMRDIDSYDGSLATKAALKLLPLVFTRPGELRHARWSDVNFETKEWRFLVTKTGIDHIVPLSDQAIQILESMRPLNGAGEYIFSTKSGRQPISDGTLNKALKLLGYQNDVIQPHGFRHTAATALAELGWGEDKIERQLSHVVPGVKGKYQKAKYLEDRRMMMIAWANYIDSLKEGAVVPPIRQVRTAG
ncbi:tyrosine-type recombinase/integrase [Undibacterium sp. JH2W]|uniref:tyrosine-type recombinase/integrase n=1 Tax=Undibacterium sp. JH2W TaxID=3413037 RepID=UPI003BF26906